MVSSSVVKMAGRMVEKLEVLLVVQLVWSMVAWTAWIKAGTMDVMLVDKSVDWLVAQKVLMAGWKAGSTAEMTAALMASLKVGMTVSALVA